MAELTLEQKIADFHRAREEVQQRVDRTSQKAWDLHRTYLDAPMPQDVTVSQPADFGGIAEPVVDPLVAEGTLDWLRTQTILGVKYELLFRPDSHTKYADPRQQGKPVVRNALFLRSIENIYDSLQQISLGQSPKQYVFTKSTRPFDELFTNIAYRILQEGSNSVEYFAQHLGAGSAAYRTDVFAQLEAAAQQPTGLLARGPFAVAFRDVTRAREIASTSVAMAKAQQFAPFILYGISSEQPVQDAREEYAPATIRVPAAQSTINRHVTASPSLAYEAPRMKHVTTRPTVKIAYSPIFGGSVYTSR